LYGGIDQTLDNEKVSIFVKDFPERGANNLNKRIYMNALTSDKLHFYENKIQVFLNTVYNNITIYKEPIVSSFRREMIEFFLAIHLGYDDYPKEILDYFSTSIDLIGNFDTNNIKWCFST
jgi:hypothetical protein